MLGAVTVQPFGLPWAPQPYGQASHLPPLQQDTFLPATPLNNDTPLQANASPLADRTSRAAAQREQQASSQQTPQPASRSRSAFVELPTEIHVALAKVLPFREQWALKRTNRYFHSIPELAAPVSFFRQRHRGRAYQQELLVALSAAAIVRRGYEPCHACQRFRWKSEFEIAQYQRGFLWCVAPASAAALPTVWSVGDEEGDVFENGKFCMECGIAAGKYRVGETVQVVEHWSDCHEDRWNFVIGEPSHGGRRTGIMISEQGQEDLERKFNECGRFGCNGKLCGEGMTSEVVLDPTAKVVDKVISR